ncbi:hypothetical protein J6500_11155 [Bradyrhizobium sp. WSM 1704]|uniref:hypothetical protein n=1 Tax=Bradyrhizobium semiaridum TaxID=2821404 RepID=UPI001CE378AA|nr:hypothetical protein [Bradyrhizobium semiaridum]MCA6122444.1 hypothetical protein [Bradyrhizobium semiaridum]
METTEARITDDKGKLIAHAITTCLVRAAENHPNAIRSARIGGMTACAGSVLALCD